MSINAMMMMMMFVVLTASPLLMYSDDEIMCMLPNISGNSFCTVNTVDGRPENDYCPRTFGDTDSFDIFLCHNQSDGPQRCKLLTEYEPVENSKEHIQIYTV